MFNTSSLILQPNVRSNSCTGGWVVAQSAPTESTEQIYTPDHHTDEPPPPIFHTHAVSVARPRRVARPRATSLGP
eukprot:7056792-Prymnesium_polylepis.1